MGQSPGSSRVHAANSIEERPLSEFSEHRLIFTWHIRRIVRSRFMKQESSITITDLDLARLGHLADAPALAPELDRADIVPFQAVSPDVVTMNSRVAFEDETTGEFRIVTIVYPQDADPSEGKISVMAPVGSALLGLSVGQSIEWCFPDGRPRTLRVIELLYQPEAAANASRSGKVAEED
jgi:regulator of nucleoside diphosphate kinase